VLYLLDLVGLLKYWVHSGKKFSQPIVEHRTWIFSALISNPTTEHNWEPFPFPFSQPVPWRFILTLSSHLVGFTSDHHSRYTIKKRNSFDLHPSLSHLTKYQIGVYYAGIRVFNHLSTPMKSIVNETEVFKKALKRFILDNSFYSIDEFFNFKE
jgi:hypothetical protein